MLSSQSSIDKKLSILFDKYRDRDFAANAQKEVEEIRRKALNLGAGTTAAIFVLNELARLSMRSPIFKLKAQNVLFWLVAPTIASKYSYDCQIHQRIDNLWRIHMNRVDQGLDGTYKEHGMYNNKLQDYTTQINNGVHMRLDSIIHGLTEKPYLDNPFQRFHQSIEEYPEFHDDIDDVGFTEYDNWERLKPFDAKDGTTVGDSAVIPTEDNDLKMLFYDVQGESVYTNPPDPNMPVIDHGLDELKVWAFNLTGYNQEVIKNNYSLNMWNATKSNHVPHWGQKLFTPAFFREEKMETFQRQWDARLGLEVIKIRQAMTNRVGDVNQRKKQKEEIEQYIQKVYQDEKEASLSDVFVTDHTPKQARFTTTGLKDDEQFFKYKQALEDYNSQAIAPVILPKKERYERGSVLQKIFEPLAGSEKLDNGAIFYKVVDSELSKDTFDEERLRAEYDRLKEGAITAIEGGEDANDEIRLTLLTDMEQQSPFKVEEFENVLDKEFSVFKKGEKYDFVKDLKDAYSSSLEKSTNEKIFDTIPEHTFWDIKTPVRADPQRFMNPYNSFRKYHTTSFFDSREYEEYMDRRTLKNNLRDGVSTYRRY